MVKLLEGGNLEIDGKQADHLDLKVTNRSFIVPVLDKLLHSINSMFQKKFKKPLWSDAILDSKVFLSGSSLHFFNVKGISDEEFVAKKPKVGDIDTMVNRDQEAELSQFLTDLKGTKFGDVTFLGFQRGNEQFSSLWQIGSPPSIKVQIDFEFVAYDVNGPTDWARFSHSSSWEDLQLGIKGVFHKWLIQSLASLTYRNFLQRKLVGRGKARQEEDIPVSDNLLSFAVSSKEGGGLRAKYLPVIDPATNKPLVKDGLPVMAAAPAANYEQNLAQIFTKLFGKKINAKALDRTWSFNGLLDLMNTLLTSEQKDKIFQQFLQKTIGPGAQGMYKNDPHRDLSEKLVAINHAMKQLGVTKPQNLNKMIDDYKKAYKMVTEAAPNYKRQGIQHIYNPGSSTEMKDADFIDFCKEIQSMGGTLNNAPINLKVDGAGIRFGKDEQGRPFFMTSRVNEPKYIENYGDFVNYGRSMGQDEVSLARTKNYDEALKTIVTANFMKDIPSDTIVQAEMLYVPMAQKSDDGLTFVNIPYDPTKIGSVMTLVPFSVREYSTGEPKKDAEKIKKKIVSNSNDKVKVIDNRLAQKDIDLSSIVDPIANNADTLLAAVKTRGDNENKEKARKILSAARQQLSKAIIDSPKLQGKDQLGSNIEGIVINMPSGRLAKVTSPAMQQKMAAKQALAKKSTVSNRSKPAVVTIGSFAGHKGHEQLIDQTIATAKKVGGDPYIYVSPVVGNDDPIPPEMKVQTLRKLYPEYANNIQVWAAEGSPMKKIEKELVLPENSPYNKIILLVGSDRYDGMKQWMDSLEKRMKDPVAVAKYGGTQNQVDFETVKTEREADKGGTGVNFTMLRDILKNPNASEQDRLNLWSNAFNAKKLGIDWIKKLMHATAAGITKQEVKEFIDKIKPLISEASNEQKAKFVELLGEAKNRLEEYNIPQTKKFIQQAHDEEHKQMYGDKPYSSHPRMVAAIGRRFFGPKFNSDAVKVALLHDVLEDTPYTANDLADRGFSPRVIEAVQLLTKNKSLSYADNIRNIINSKNPLAMMVKYCDNYMNYTGDKSHWDSDKAKASQSKYLASLNMLGKVLGIDQHTVTEDKEEEDPVEVLWKRDADERQALDYAKLHYPNAPSKQTAFVKFVLRSIRHAKSDDNRQDSEIALLLKRVNSLQDQVNAAKEAAKKASQKIDESTDYLEEK